MIQLIAKDSPGRIQLLDAARGLSILLMVAYHFGYDLVLFNLLPHNVLYNPLLNVLQPFFAGLFIFVSGISCRFSRSNLRRGVEMLALAAVITAVTYWMGSPAWFGIIHFLGVSAILFALLRPFLDRIPGPPLAGIYLVLFFLGNYLAGQTYEIRFLWWLGLRHPEFRSSDYFPLLPWFFLYLAGALAGRYIVANKLPKRFYTLRIPFFAAVGRNTLLIYALHQPVLYGLTILLSGVFS